MSRSKSSSSTNDLLFRATKLELRAASTVESGLDPLPEGVCGRITGIALVYDVVDDYGTMFASGCLARTRTEKVSQGKVKLFADHGPFTETHVGTVRSIDDIGDGAVMTADLLDTEAGRKMKEYIGAVLASGGETGLSVGFRGRDKEWRQMDAKQGGDTVLVYKEIELREISVTPVPAVPGTDVTGVRAEGSDDEAAEEGLLRRTLRSILKSLPEREAREAFEEVYRASSAESSDTPAAPPATPDAVATDADANSENATVEVESEISAIKGWIATEEERHAALRRSYSVRR